MAVLHDETRRNTRIWRPDFAGPWLRSAVVAGRLNWIAGLRDLKQDFVTLEKDGFNIGEFLQVLLDDVGDLNRVALDLEQALLDRHASATADDHPEDAWLMDALFNGDDAPLGVLFNVTAEGLDVLDVELCRYEGFAEYKRIIDRTIPALLHQDDGGPEECVLEIRRNQAWHSLARTYAPTTWLGDTGSNVEKQDEQRGTRRGTPLSQRAAGAKDDEIVLNGGGLGDEIKNSVIIYLEGFRRAA